MIRDAIVDENQTPYTNEERAKMQDDDTYLYFRPLDPTPTASEWGAYTKVERFRKHDRGTHIASTGNEEPGSFIYRLVVANVYESRITPFGPEFCNAAEAREAYAVLERMRYGQEASDTPSPPSVRPGALQGV